MSLENQIMVEEGLCGASGLMEKNGKTATGEIEGLMESQFVDYKHRKPDWVRLVSGGPGRELVRVGLFPHSGEFWKMFSKPLQLMQARCDKKYSFFNTLLRVTSKLLT
mgnify:CR=1 FL=1